MTILLNLLGHIIKPHTTEKNFPGMRINQRTDNLKMITIIIISQIQIGALLRSYPKILFREKSYSKTNTQARVTVSQTTYP